MILQNKGNTRKLLWKMAVNPLMTQLMIIPICLHHDHNVDFKGKKSAERRIKHIWDNYISDLDHFMLNYMTINWENERSLFLTEPTANNSYTIFSISFFW